MTKENENVSVANKRNYTEEEINAAYKKGKDEGRMIENLQRDNSSLNQKLQEIKK